ncbi:Quinone oxidoreductase-like protein 2 [Tetrabaena socialis]|uniref:Quinone oxidoreductase-like protein 2 n=1 Tax=Tetrabaena socialis TaxID=47790 RepID=A0A2J8A3L2_9CHLO|nr:Quinone oxidoreductase-like protein 2 [Tetrabaena socialis]|eukprot:PNH07115.1 Quinone oxidoreductase-like protein 2 [Tetrabaena socialis]
MRAIVCEGLGDARTKLGDGVLRLANDHPTPKLSPGTTRILVAAASINFPDALQIKGEYQDKPPLPFIPGSEVSGVVAEVAAGVTAFRVGDKVCAVKQGGSFAEQVVVPAGAVWKIPGGVGGRGSRVAVAKSSLKPK